MTVDMEIVIPSHSSMIPLNERFVFFRGFSLIKFGLECGHVGVVGVWFFCVGLRMGKYCLMCFLDVEPHIYELCNMTYILPFKKCIIYIVYRIIPN